MKSIVFNYILGRWLEDKWIEQVRTSIQYIWTINNLRVIVGHNRNRIVFYGVQMKILIAEGEDSIRAH